MANFRPASARLKAGAAHFIRSTHSAPVMLPWRTSATAETRTRTKIRLALEVGLSRERGFIPPEYHLCFFRPEGAFFRVLWGLRIPRTAWMSEETEWL